MTLFDSISHNYEFPVVGGACTHGRILTLSPLFEKQHISTYLELNITNIKQLEKQISTLKKLNVYYSLVYIFILYSNMQNLTQNLMDTLKTSIYNNKTPKGTNTYVFTYLQK